MWVTMMIEYEGRMMSTEDVLKAKNNTKKVIIKPKVTPKEEIKEEIIDIPKEEIKEVITNDLEKARIKYQEIFGRKPQPNAKLETLLDKITKASEA